MRHGISYHVNKLNKEFIPWAMRKIEVSPLDCKVCLFIKLDSKILNDIRIHLEERSNFCFIERSFKLSQNLRMILFQESRKTIQFFYGNRFMRRVVLKL